MRKLILCLVIIINITGCASSKFPSEQRAAIKRVSVADPTMPEKPTVFGGGSGAGFLLAGPLGLALANAGNDMPTLYMQTLKNNNIDIARITKEDIESGLRQQGFQVVSSGQSADAIVKPMILQYGLTGNIFASPPVRVPQLWLRIDIVRPSNEKIWWNYAAIHIMPDALEKLDAHLVEDFLKDEKLLNKEVHKASKLVVNDIMSKM